jgi:deoxyribonuclease V
MILAFDTYYFENKAKTVCISFNNWMDQTPEKVYFECLFGFAEYYPGEFYTRELPCIVSLLKKIELSDIQAIVIDGFVTLDDIGTFGLGGHLYDHLNGKIPVLGVAKSSFVTMKNQQNELLRGNSKKPLYVTSLGLKLEIAIENIKAMDGNYRIPTLLKLLDRITKEKNCS